MFKLRFLDMYERAVCFSLNKECTKNFYLGQNAYSKCGIRTTDALCGTIIQGI